MKNTEQFKKLGILLEKDLHDQLYHALQGELVEVLLKIGDIKKENYWRHVHESSSFKVDEVISEKLYRLFHGVKDSLGFTEKIDFYITNSSDVNAYAVSSFEENVPHIINVNSGLLELMNDDELKFIIGHEIGHLINKNAELSKLIDFVFPNPQSIPLILHYKIRLWKQLSELIADRIGFVAHPDLSVYISSFFKMTSGLDTKMVDLNSEAYLEANDRKIAFFKDGTFLNTGTHPIIPIRIKAMSLFSESDLYKNFANSGDDSTDEGLQEKTDELINLLLNISSSDMDYFISLFIASAGIIIAGLDGEVDEKEIEIVMHNLSEFRIFPRNFINNLYSENKALESFEAAIKYILEHDPSQKERMLSYMITLVMADKNVVKEEFEFIFEIGSKYFGYSYKEIARIFGSVIQSRYVPSIHALS